MTTNARIVVRKIAEDLKKVMRLQQLAIDDRLMNELGYDIQQQMLELIIKGISPIEGAGRFPAYKWAGIANDLNKEIKGFKTRLNRALASSTKRKLSSSIETRKSAIRDIKADKYPYNTEEFKQGSKRVRPVNLFLTGEFLFHLEAVLVGVAGKYGLEIGFFTPDQAIKEIGHREGANGQPKRPIIPIDREDFAQSIQNIIYGKTIGALDRSLNRGSIS